MKIHHPKTSEHPPKLKTLCFNFFWEQAHINRFFAFIIRLAMDPNVAGKVTLSSLDAAFQDDSRSTTKFLAFNEQFINQLFICRGVDSFLTYISELLGLIFRTRPETLKSNETVRLDYVLEHSSMEELINGLVERRVNQLSYQGMRDLTTDLKQKLKFDLFTTTNALNQAIRIIKIRNIIVHNRGRINNIFLSRVKDCTQKEGELIALNGKTTYTHIDFLTRAVSDIDIRAAAKFKLQRAVYDKWLV